MNDLISRRAAIDMCREPRMRNADCSDFEMEIMMLPSTQPEIIYCKDCKYWNSGSCECREHAVNCQDYYVGDIETDAEHFCGYAERKNG